MDYLIGCEYNVSTGQLWQVAGTNEGAVGIFPIDDAAAAAGRPLYGPVAAVMQGGNSAVSIQLLIPVMSAHHPCWQVQSPKIKVQGVHA